MRDHFADIEARHAADLARILLEHARVQLARAVEETTAAEIDAHVAAERLSHAMRIQRHWTMRAERAVMHLAVARDALD